MYVCVCIFKLNINITKQTNKKITKLYNKITKTKIKINTHIKQTKAKTHDKIIKQNY